MDFELLLGEQADPALSFKSGREMAVHERFQQVISEIRLVRK
jgi:hypothetical protein